MNIHALLSCSLRSLVAIYRAILAPSAFPKMFWVKVCRDGEGVPRSGGGEVCGEGHTRTQTAPAYPALGSPARAMATSSAEYS